MPSCFHRAPNILIFAGTVFPFQMCLIPLFFGFPWAGLLNSRLGLCLFNIAICIPFPVLVFSVRDKAQFYTSDDRFHGLIAVYDGCAAVVPELARVKLHVDRFRQLMVAGVEELPVVVGQHGEIAEAIARRDLAAAEERLRRLLGRIFSYVATARARFPAYVEESAD